MNVKICTFPEGEDPDSFAKNNSLEELTLFLEENSKDFISFKASILAAEAKNDPIKKAETIHNMVTSISKISDLIKQEIYIQECSKIMDISEEVLFNTLAQILKKESKESVKRAKPNNAFEVISAEKQPHKKIDVQYELERKIIELLLLYGIEEEQFEELTVETDEKGNVTYKSEIVKTKIFEKIYLELQEDEIEFANEEFKSIYFNIIESFNQSQEFKIDKFINKLSPDIAEAVTHIIMDGDKYVLHNWIGKEIYVKDKKDTLTQLVNETILNLRRFLVTQKINELAQKINKSEDDEAKMEVLSETLDYTKLKKLLSDKLNRVL
jgi:DNA primase